MDSQETYIYLSNKVLNSPMPGGTKNNKRTDSDSNGIGGGTGVILYIIFRYFEYEFLSVGNIFASSIMHRFKDTGNYS